MHSLVRFAIVIPVALRQPAWVQGGNTDVPGEHLDEGQPIPHIEKLLPAIVDEPVISTQVEILGLQVCAVGRR